MELAKLVIKMNSGSSLPKKSVEQVAKQLERIHQISSAVIGYNAENYLDEVYEHLLVLGKARAKEQRKLIEYYLNIQDPTTVSLVLEILCLTWGETEEFFERLIHFALGSHANMSHWDIDDDVRITAIKILGEYLNSKLDAYRTSIAQSLPIREPLSRERETLNLLCAIFEEEHNNLFTRIYAYFSMCRAYGLQASGLPSISSLIKLDTDDTVIDWNMIALLRNFSS